MTSCWGTDVIVDKLAPGGQDRGGALKMPRSSIASAVIVSCLAIAGHATSPRAAFPAPCASVDTLGLDPSAADNTVFAFRLSGVGRGVLGARHPDPVDYGVAPDPPGNNYLFRSVVHNRSRFCQ